MATPKTESKTTKIYSQASNDVVIPKYKDKKEKTGEQSQSKNVIEKAIIIRGGANVAYSASNKEKKETKFAVTEVNAEELEILKAHPGFMRRVSRGFITIGEAPEVLKADKSAQMTEDQLKAKTKAEVKTGKVED